MRERFQRVEDGNIVGIEVDVNAFAYSNVYPWLLSIFIKFDVSQEDEMRYEEFLEIKESLIISLEHDEVAKYVGSRMVDGWYELYFYAQESKNLNTQVAHMLTSTQYVYETSVVRDAKWDFHYKNLLPNELELCHIESEKIIAQLQEEGDTLDVPRVVEHYVSFELPTQKNRFLNTLALEDFSVKDEIATDEFEYGVALSREHCVTSSTLREVVSALFVEIKKAQGYYEGWSTTLVVGDDV